VQEVAVYPRAVSVNVRTNVASAREQWRTWVSVPRGSVPHQTVTSVWVLVHVCGHAKFFSVVSFSLVILARLVYNVIQSGPKKCIHTLTWKILLYNRNYCIYTKAKLIWEMSLNFGFNVGVRSGHNRHPNTVEAAELLQECIHFFGPFCMCQNLYQINFPQHRTWKQYGSHYLTTSTSITVATPSVFS